MTRKLQNTYGCHQAVYFRASTDWRKQSANLESQGTFFSLSDDQVLICFKYNNSLSGTKSETFYHSAVCVI
jgi:hypothetical protein